MNLEMLEFFLHLFCYNQIILKYRLNKTKELNDIFSDKPFYFLEFEFNVLKNQNCAEKNNQRKT